MAVTEIIFSDHVKLYGSKSVILIMITSKNTLFRYITRVVSAMCILLCVSSCQKNKKDEPLEPSSECERVVVVYAVGSNNLSSYLDSDMREMCQGMEQVDTDRFRLLLYRVQMDDAGARTTTTPELMIMRKRNGTCEFVKVKEYDRQVASTDPERINQVLEDVRRLYPATSYGLIFWSHSDAWRPSPGWQPKDRSFGQHWDGTAYRYCETPDLAAAIPDGMADFIWFDSCYMANIETAYEFRGKCRYFIGSVMELNAFGMPYDLTLPILLSSDCDTAKAASLTCDYYNTTGSPVSMTVIDMDRIEPLADACERVYAHFTPLTGNESLRSFSRVLNTPLYDFGMYTRAIVQDKDSAAMDAFEQALENCIVYKGVSRYDFNGREIYPDQYSGLTCHSYQERNTREEEMYRTLAWYHRVYPHSEQ